MRIGITGGTGFMGSHLARRLVDADHQVVLVSRGTDHGNAAGLEREGARFHAASVSDRDALADAFDGCDAVAHLAGINLERGDQTYQAVHVEGTEHVVDAGNATGVSKVVLASFLRARPDCGSAYHESKWRAEEIVRGSAIPYTVLKPGVTYGPGDHMVAHVSRSLLTVPVFPLIGFDERRLRPLAIEDLVDLLVAALTTDRLRDTTVGVVGPEELSLRAAVRRIGDVLGRRPLVFPLPVSFHYIGAWLQEKLMRVPITARAQVRILAEDVVEPAPADVCEPIPDDLRPSRPFSRDRIEAGITDRRRYGLGDLRL